MILCHLFLLLQAANVCPMVFFGGTFARGSRGVRRIHLLSVASPTIHRHLAGDTFSAELSRCRREARWHGHLDFGLTFPSCSSAVGWKVLEPTRSRIFRLGARN
jgi:hypothetical protein